MGDKQIIVEMEESVFEQLEQELSIKAVCGNLWGASDAFIFRILDAIKKGASKVHLVMPPRKMKESSDDQV